MKLAYVEYAFLFDPTKTWARLYQFEVELRSFLAQKGLEGVIMDTLGTGKKVVYIRPTEKMDLPIQPEKSIPLKKSFERLMSKKRKKG